MHRTDVLPPVSTRGRLQFDAARIIPGYSPRTPRGTEVSFGGYGDADITAATAVFGSFASRPAPAAPPPPGRGAARLQAAARSAIINLSDVMKVEFEDTRTLFRLSKPTLVAKATLASSKQVGALTSPMPIEDIVNAQADEVLTEVYRFDHKDVQTASFVVYDRLEDMLHNGSYDLCDRILRRVAVSKISTTVMRSLLTITWESRQKLTERAGLFTRVEREMTRIRGPEVTKRLLCRLS